MKKFHIYVLISFVKYLLIVQLFVTMMSLFSAAIGDSKLLAKYDYSFLSFARLLFYDVMLNFNLVMPATVTVATIVVILLMMRNHELLAYVSLGGTIVSLAIPFVTVGAAISAGMIAVEYKVAPYAREAREEILSSMRGQKYVKMSGYTDLWLVDGGDKLINIDVVNITDREIAGVKEFYFNDLNQIVRIETTDGVKWENGEWIAEGRKFTDISQNPPIVEDLSPGPVHNKLWSDLLSVTSSNVRSLTPTELSKMSRVLQSRGADVSKYKMSLYSKYANALSVIVLLILTFPIAINFSRNYSLIKNAAVTFSLGLLYWLFQAVCASLGKTGVLSPFPANFLPLILFFFISLGIIYKRQRTK